LEDAFSYAGALSALSEAKEGLLSKALGINVTESSGTYAGQPSTCVNIKVHGSAVKYCVTKNGLLSYSSYGKGQYFELTKYSSHPPSSLFKLPAGATTVTIP
jgi:hypothetical protein